MITFIGNYLYGLYKIDNSSYTFDESINIKVVSPNFSIKDYNTEDETSKLKRLIKISDPEKNKKMSKIGKEK